MGPILTTPQKRLLAAIFERGAEEASQALSKWLGQAARLTVSEVDEVDLAEATDLLGPADELVASCALELSGRLTGHLLLVFGDRSGLALADLLLGRPLGTSTAWGELERSAAMETANIVGCAYLNSLSAHLPAQGGAPGSLLPSPPTFRHEFAGSLLEFALMEQAIRLDQLLLARTRFEAEHLELDWSLLLVPSGESLELIAAMLSEPRTP
jgi:chemotaxis protein CheC